MIDTQVEKETGRMRPNPAIPTSNLSQQRHDQPMPQAAGAFVGINIFFPFLEHSGKKTEKRESQSRPLLRDVMESQILISIACCVNGQSCPDSLGCIRLQRHTYVCDLKIPDSTDGVTV